MKERQCDSCGYHPLRRFARAGRTEVYNGKLIELPADLALIECERCGERYDSVEDIEKLDAIARGAQT